MLSAQRFRAISTVIFAMSGLTAAAFLKLPRTLEPPRRKTVTYYHARADRNRYTSAMLRNIRATGQHRERARRRRQMAAIAA